MYYKSKYTHQYYIMEICNCPNEIIILCLCIIKVPIQQVDYTNFLGVIIDDKIKWPNHISYINSKIAKETGIICRARNFFSKSALINLYYAFIFPYLIYCVEVWGNAFSTHVQPFIKMTK